MFAACLFSDIHIHLLSSTHSHEKEVPGALFHCSHGGPQPQHGVLNACPRAGTPGWQGMLESEKRAEGHLHHQCEPSQGWAGNILSGSLDWLDHFDREVRDYWALVRHQGSCCGPLMMMGEVVLVLLLSVSSSHPRVDLAVSWPGITPLLLSGLFSHHGRRDSFLPSVHVSVS